MEELIVTDVSKTYQNGRMRKEVLRHVTLPVNKEEFVAIVGTSGCGKTTLLKIIGGLDAPDTGKVFIKGVDLSAFTGDEMVEYRRRNIGFVFQDYQLLPNLTAFENIILPIRLDGMDVDLDYIGSLMEELGIGETGGSTPDMLSGGQQQRVAIARALAMRPALLLADEPTGNLDSGTTKEVMELIRQVNKKFHQTLLLVTHDEKVAAMADRLIRMQDGALTGQEEPDAERTV